MRRFRSSFTTPTASSIWLHSPASAGSSPYGVTKLCRETPRAPTVSLGSRSRRIGLLHGLRKRPGMAFTRIIRTLCGGGTFTISGTGEQRRDVMYAADAIAATVAAMERCPFRQRQCERGASGPPSNGVGLRSVVRLILAQSCRFRRLPADGVGLSDGFASRRSPVRSRYAPLLRRADARPVV